MNTESMHVKPRVGPGEHAVRRLDIHEFAAHEQPEHGTAEALGERRDIVQGAREAADVLKQLGTIILPARHEDEGLPPIQVNVVAGCQIVPNRPDEE